MSTVATRFAQTVLVAVTAMGCLFVSERALTTQDGSFLASAEARVGRPLTPMSYAGVARRTTRRAVVGGAAVGAAAVAVAPGCVQAVDAYGRVYTRCY